MHLAHFALLLTLRLSSTGDRAAHNSCFRGCPLHKSMARWYASAVHQHLADAHVWDITGMQ